MPDTPEPAEPIWFATLTPAQRAELKSTQGTPLFDRPDVLIVGGGIVGLALTYYLAEQGARIQLIEAEHLACGASGANFGGIWPNEQGASHSAGFQALAFLSRDLWGRLSVRPDFDFDWRVNGFLNVNPEKFAPSAPEYAARAQEQGYAVTAVDAAQIARLEPNLRPGLATGLHYPSEAHIHPVKATLSFLRAARRRQARVASGVHAVSCSISQERVVAVETTAGRIEPGHVVAATGWKIDWLEQNLLASLPLRPVSGQLISTDPLSPLLKSSVGGKFLIAQLRSGEVLTGANVLEGPVLTPDPQLSAQFAEAARDLVPALQGIPFTRTWCGLRPGTTDGMPILDRAPFAANLWLACGHYRNGMLLAPATGKLLGEWILNGTAADELAPFGWKRFASVNA